MEIIDLLIMGICVYLFTFALCILYKISDELEQADKQISNISKIKVMLTIFLILFIYPFFIVYKKYIKNSGKSISLFKLYYNTILSTPKLLNTAISILIKNEKNVVMK